MLVSVGISGTSGGFRKFCRGEIDISDASRPINVREMADCRAAGIEYLELPVAFDAITLVVHPRNEFLRSITMAELRRLWEPAAEGRILRWNQINPAWPDEPVKLFSPGSDSGTFDYFSEAVVGTARASRRDVTTSGTTKLSCAGDSVCRTRSVISASRITSKTPAGSRRWRLLKANDRQWHRRSRP